MPPRAATSTSWWWKKDRTDRFAEMVRLNRLLRSFDIAIDLLVVSEEKFQYWHDTPGNIYYEAALEGKVLYEAA